MGDRLECIIGGGEPALSVTMFYPSAPFHAIAIGDKFSGAVVKKIVALFDVGLFHFALLLVGPDGTEWVRQSTFCGEYLVEWE